MSAATAWMPGVWAKGDTVEVRFPTGWVKPKKGTLLYRHDDRHLPAAVQRKNGPRWQFARPNGSTMTILERWIIGEVRKVPEIVIYGGHLIWKGERVKPWDVEVVWDCWENGTLHRLRCWQNGKRR